MLLKGKHTNDRLESIKALFICKPFT